MATVEVTQADRDVEREIASKWPYVANVPSQQGVIAARHRLTSSQSHAAEIAQARADLIECGRAAGAFLADDVSDEFLRHVPGEVKARIERLQARVELEAKRPKLPRLTEAMMRAAAKAHFGWDKIDGIDMTAADENFTFRQFMQRIWPAIRKELNKETASCPK